MFNCSICCHVNDETNCVKNIRFVNNDMICDAFKPYVDISEEGTADPVNVELHYWILNAFEYICRFRNTGDDEDIKKANIYLSKYLELRDKD